MLTIDSIALPFAVFVLSSAAAAQDDASSAATPVYYGGRLIGVTVRHPDGETVSYSRDSRPFFDVQQIHRPGLLDPNQLKGKRVLDVGTGPGSVVRVLRNAGVDAYGVDIVLGPAEKTSPFFVEADARKLPFPNQHFDLVVATWSVLTYEAGNPLRAGQFLREFARVLKPGGTISISPARHPEVLAVIDGIPELRVTKMPGQWVNAKESLELQRSGGAMSRAPGWPGRLKGEAGGAALFGAAYMAGKAIDAAVSGDPRKLSEGVYTLRDGRFWGNAAAFSVIAQSVQGPVKAVPILRAVVPLAAGMTAVDALSGRWPGRHTLVDTAGYATAELTVGTAMDKLLRGFLPATGRAARIAGPMYSIWRLALILYVGQELGERLDGVAPLLRRWAP